MPGHATVSWTTWWQTSTFIGSLDEVAAVVIQPEKGMMS